MTDQTAPKPIVTRAAESVVNGWTFAVGLLPSINSLITTLAIPALCLALGIGGTIGVQKATAPISLPVALPDLPKAATATPVPVVSMDNLDHALALHCGGLRERIDVLIQRTEPKGALKKASARARG